MLILRLTRYSTHWEAFPSAQLGGLRLADKASKVETSDPVSTTPHALDRSCTEAVVQTKARDELRIYIFLLRINLVQCIIS